MVNNLYETEAYKHAAKEIKSRSKEEIQKFELNMAIANIIFVDTRRLYIFHDDSFEVQKVGDKSKSSIKCFHLFHPDCEIDKSLLDFMNNLLKYEEENNPDKSNVLYIKAAIDATNLLFENAAIAHESHDRNLYNRGYNDAQPTYYYR